MKKRNLLFSILMALCLLCFAACKDKNQSENVVQPVAPSVTATISLDETYYVGDKLEDIQISLSANSTSGTIAWEDKNYELVLGENSCKWVFTPTDSAAYTSKTGTIIINAVNRLIVPEVTNVHLKAGDTAYVGANLSTVELECNSDVEGTIAWRQPTSLFVEGENDYAWVFTPTDTTTYDTKYGIVTLNVTEQQYLTSIEVISNTKTEGFVAFNEYDCTGLTLRLIYNAGKQTPITITSNEQCLVIYQFGNCLHAGDTSVTVEYLGVSFLVDGLSVGKKTIEKPTFTDEIYYDGTVKELGVEASANYTFTPREETNAGTYNLTVTLADSSNYKWTDTDNASIVVECVILKGEQNITKHEVNVEYDGETHYSYVTSDGATGVYYSENELVSSNYSVASTNTIGYINVGTYTVYYYAVGDGNHQDESGWVVVTIGKQQTSLDLNSCYSVATGSAINYPESYVTILDKENNPIATENLTYTYYYSYLDDGDDTNDQVTSNALGGAAENGSAPQNARNVPYYVVVEYAGSGNYAASSAVIDLFIDNTNNGFYDTTGSNPFAFKDDPYTYTFGGGSLSINGSIKECTCYLEFKLLPINSDGLSEIQFDAKFGSGSSAIKTGRLVYVYDKTNPANSSYVIVDEDDNVTAITLNGTDITLEINSVSTTISKWSIPKYLATYTAETMTEEDYQTACGLDNISEDKIPTSKNTTITIYNDYGTIRFVIDYNVKYISGDVPKGGHGTWYGVVEVGHYANNGNHYKLDFYKLSDNTGYRANAQQTCCMLYWYVTTTVPTTLTLADGTGSYLTNPMNNLINTYTRVVA